MFKKLAIALMLVAHFGYAQAQSRFITVTGSAEMSIVPDEITLSITIVGDSEKKLSENEEKFYSVLEKHNIKKEFVSFNDYSFSWYYWWYYYDRYRTQKTFNLTLQKGTDILAFVKDLKQTWVTSLSIAKSTHSELTKFRKEVKMEAARAAKEKASYMLESVGEKVGKLISMEEVNAEAKPAATPYYWGYNNNLNSNSNSNISMPSGGGGGGDSSNDGIDNVQKIKLRFEVVARFEIL